MSTESTPRERLIAQVAVLKSVAHGDHVGFDVDTAWKRGEEFVAALEAKPDEAVQCPCCEKLVTLCRQHYQLHEPGKPCIDCRRAE